MWILALIAANIGIFFLERTYRTIDTSGWTMETLLYVVIAVTVSQVSLYKGFSWAPSLIFAGAMFTLTNAVLRVGNTLLLGEDINRWVLIGLAVMVFGVIIISYSKTLVT